MEYKVKIITGPMMSELEGMSARMVANVDSGVLELYREDGELPFAGYGWEEIEDFEGEERGKIGKKRILRVFIKGNKLLEVEIVKKRDIQKVVSDMLAFKKAAEQKNPKGGIKHSFESLKEVISLTKAKRDIESAKNKASSSFSAAKGKLSNLSKDRREKKE